MITEIDCRKLLLARLAPVLGWCSFAASSSTALQASDYKSAILDAWVARENKVNEAVFVVKMSTLVSKGTYNGRRNNSANGDLPPEDTYIRRRVTLYVSGKLRRFEYKGETYHLTKQAPLPVDGVLVVQEGGEVRELKRHEHNLQVPLQGTIKNQATQLQEQRNWPLFYFCRPLSTQLDEYKVIKLRSGGVAGDNIELATVDGSRLLVVDPGRDYSIVRYTCNFTRKGKSSRRSQLDIEYEFDKDYGWVPKNWVTTMHKNDKLTDCCECVSESYRLNPTLDSSLFTLSFPPGSHVFDMLDPDVQVRYVYLKGGQRKEISRSKLRRVPTVRNSSSSLPADTGSGKIGY